MLFKFLFYLFIGYLLYLGIKAVLLAYQVYSTQKKNMKGRQSYRNGRVEKDISKEARIIDEKPLNSKD